MIVDELLKNLALVAVGAPLLGCLIVGLMGKRIGNAGAWVTIILMTICFLASVDLFRYVVLDGNQFTGTVYTWGTSGNIVFEMGFLLDPLTAIMMVTVSLVSLLVHIYSIGYMKHDPGYTRFFSYMSLFTFAMLLLVTANNFLQLFFGWEGVGLVSYLLIGFWFKKESAAVGSLKAFLVNRIGDFGFILGIAAIVDYTNSLDYSQVFAQANNLSHLTIAIFPHTNWLVITVICILLFIGAMGKSAQIPLHVWLPESMEGPTPISALIHAATMVTAGIFMVARMSPLFELSQVAQSVVMIIGATGALFLGLLAFVENDIKRVIAYSTMSQLGYMMAADGASAFSAGIFHLMTHAGFKALLFLAAGSVIIAMHHEQDLTKMGGLRKYLPVTYICFLIGALALAAIPPFSGFYSKDAIIEAVHHAEIPGAHYAYWALLIGSFVTAYYIFRAFFLAFHTKERMNEDIRSHLNEKNIMLFPIIILAIISVVAGAAMVGPMLYNSPNWLGNSVQVLPANDVITQISSEYHGVINYALDAVWHLPLWFALAGILLAWINYIAVPALPKILKRKLALFYFILANKYGFDAFNRKVFERGARSLSHFLFYYADEKLLDDYMVNGTGRTITRLSGWMRRMQTGYLYHYLFVMIIGVLAFLGWMYIVR